MNEKTLETILNVFLKEVLPLTEKGVAKGSKIFGAAIIKKDDLSVVIAETNNEIENPLWHGEMHFSMPQWIFYLIVCFGNYNW